MRHLVRRFTADETAATAIEYALIASLVSVAIIGSLIALNGSMTDLFEYIRAHIQPPLEDVT